MHGFELISGVLVCDCVLLNNDLRFDHIGIASLILTHVKNADDSNYATVTTVYLYNSITAPEN